MTDNYDFSFKLRNLGYSKVWSEYSLADVVS